MSGVSLDNSLGLPAQSITRKTFLPEAQDSIKLEVIGLPTHGRRERQMDFSMYPGEIGLEWAEALGNRLIPADRIPAFTLFRFRQGEYGTHTLPDGSIHTGGLQQEMERMDMTLAELFPVSIHVAFISSAPREPYQLSQPHWRGTISVYPIALSSLNPDENVNQLRSLVEKVNPDILHLHDPHNALDRALIESLPEHVGVVASNHGAPLTSLSEVRQKMNYLQKFVKRYHEYRALGGDLQALRLTISDSVRFISRCLLGADAIATRVNREALKHGHGTYHAFNLSAVSEAGMGNLKKLPAIVVHPPVDADFFSPERVDAATTSLLRGSLNLAEHQPLLLYHARVCAMKGQAYLPQVIAETKRRTALPFKVILVGPESESGAVHRLNQEIERFGLRDSFVVLGGRSQEFIRDMLGISTLCLFPSFNEGLGLTAVEAQLMRVPVVGHGVGGIPEAVRHGVTGSLVAPGDVSGFAREICRLLESPQLRREYGVYGRDLMIREFNPRSVATRVMESLYLPQILNLGRATV